MTTINSTLRRPDRWQVRGGGLVCHRRAGTRSMITRPQTQDGGVLGADRAFYLIVN